MDNAQVPSFMDSDDSDDAVNSSSAKVYFGPILSPEKKFVSELNQPWDTTVDRQNDITMGSSESVPPILLSPAFPEQGEQTIRNFYDMPSTKTPIRFKQDSHRSNLFAEDGQYLLRSKVLSAHT